MIENKRNHLPQKKQKRRGYGIKSIQPTIIHKWLLFFEGKHWRGIANEKKLGKEDVVKSVDISNSIRWNVEKVMSTKIYTKNAELLIFW